MSSIFGNTIGVQTLEIQNHYKTNKHAVNSGNKIREKALGIQ